MAGTRSGNFMNWVNVSATPSAGGTATNITEVTDVAPDLDATAEKFYGDNRRLPKLVRMTEYSRTLSITTGDAAAANALVPGIPYTVVATLCDALNGTGTGAITYTMKNCVLKKNGIKASNNKFGEVTLEFEAFSDDATAVDTDPFSFVVAS